MRLVRSTIRSPVGPCPSMARITCWVASRPISCIGCAIAVTGGSMMASHGRSSNAIRAMSSGTLIRRNRRAPRAAIVARRSREDCVWQGPRHQEVKGSTKVIRIGKRHGAHQGRAYFHPAVATSSYVTVQALCAWGRRGRYREKRDAPPSCVDEVAHRLIGGGLIVNGYAGQGSIRGTCRQARWVCLTPDLGGASPR